LNDHHNHAVERVAKKAPLTASFLRRFAPQECGDNSLIALNHGASEKRAVGTRQSTSTPATRAASYRRIRQQSIEVKMTKNILRWSLMAILILISPLIFIEVLTYLTTYVEL
jgi:hypothetical protein